MNTPVALILFNRPERTRRVFEAIRAAKPKQLFIIADGPRTPEESGLCKEARAVTEVVDWECEVKRNYADKNVGIRKRPAQGISWVFENVDRAIILEDDCLPDPTFFPFCEELLERFKDNNRVMHISGDNFQQHNPSFDCKDSYYFSLVPHIWGWATWRRAWQHYDGEFLQWPRAKQEHLLSKIFNDPAVAERWEFTFDNYHSGAANTWDGAWAFACLMQGAMCVNPAVNLISNIGFGAGASTTSQAGGDLAELPTQAMTFPLRHPDDIRPNSKAEAYVMRYVFEVNKYPGQKVRWFFRSRFPRAYRALKSLVKTSS